MPVAAGVVDADVAIAVHDVGDDQYLGMLGMQILVEDMDLEIAEAAAERDLPGLVDALVAEQQHGVLVPGPLDGGEGRVVEIPREVHAAHLGAERRVEGCDVRSHRQEILAAGG